MTVNNSLEYFRQGEDSHRPIFCDGRMGTYFVDGNDSG